MAYGKKTEKNRFGYMIGSLVACIAITYLVFNIVDGWSKYKESTKRLEASVNSYEELTEQYKELQKSKALETSTTGYEMHVRSKFDLMKPDEHIVFISSEEVTNPLIEEKGIQKIIHTFKNFFN